MKIYRSLVLPILLYGSETWTLAPSQMSHVHATYLTHLRIITHLNFTVTIVDGQLDYKAPSTFKILQTADAAKIDDIIRQSRLRLAGQLYRQPVAPLTWGSMNIERAKKPKRGTRCTSWQEIVAADMKELHLIFADAEKMGEWHQRTKALVHSKR